MPKNRLTKYIRDDLSIHFGGVDKVKREDIAIPSEELCIIAERIWKNVAVTFYNEGAYAVWLVKLGTGVIKLLAVDNKKNTVAECHRLATYPNAPSVIRTSSRDYMAFMAFLRAFPFEMRKDMNAKQFTHFISSAPVIRM